MQSLALSDIPGLNAALAGAKQRQFVTRENSLLNLSYDLCGLKVRTMTVRDYVLLERIGTPFLSRAEPTMTDVAMFLWVMSPQFNWWISKWWLKPIQPARAFFYSRKVNRKFGRDIPATSEALVVAIFEYIDTMFYDSPPAITQGHESCLGYLTGWFDAVQSSYHFSSEQVWSMGLPELFQRLGAINRRNNPSVPQFNRGTDTIKLFILRGLRHNEFTMDDLKAGNVKFPPNILSSN